MRATGGRLGARMIPVLVQRRLHHSAGARDGHGLWHPSEGSSIEAVCRHNAKAYKFFLQSLRRSKKKNNTKIAEARNVRGKPQCTEHLQWWIFFLVCRERTSSKRARMTTPP